MRAHRSEVETKVLMIPNAVSRRLIFKLAMKRSSPADLEAFASVPLKAMVEYRRHHVRRTVYLRLGLDLVTLAMLIIMGTQQAGNIDWDGTLLGQLFLAATVPLLTAVAILHVLHLLCAILVVQFVHLGEERRSARLSSLCRWVLHYVCLAPDTVWKTVMLTALLPVSSEWYQMARTCAMTPYSEVVICLTIAALANSLLSRLREMRSVGPSLISVVESIKDSKQMILLMASILMVFTFSFQAADGTSFVQTVTNLFLALVINEGDGMEDLSGFGADEDGDFETPRKQTLNFLRCTFVLMCLAHGLVSVCLMTLLQGMYVNNYDQYLSKAQSRVTYYRVKQLMTIDVVQELWGVVGRRFAYDLEMACGRLAWVGVAGGVALLATSLYLACFGRSVLAGCLLALFYILLETELTFWRSGRELAAERGRPRALWVTYGQEKAPLDSVNASLQDIEKRVTSQTGALMQVSRKCHPSSSLA